MNPDHEKYLKTTCNKLLYGYCSIRACLKRGGCDFTAPINFELSTCIPYEIHTILNTKSLSTDPEWAKLADQRIAERKRKNTPWSDENEY